MRTVRTGRTEHELTEVGQPTRCSGCGQPFEQRKYTTSWRNCLCTDGERGHRIWICHRDGCHEATEVPVCVGGDLPHPLAGHDHRGQHGPTASFGDEALAMMSDRDCL